MSSVWKKSGTVTIIISKVKGQRKKNDSKILPRIEEQNSHIYIKRKFESVKIFDLGVFVGVNFYELIFEMNNDYES